MPPPSPNDRLVPRQPNAVEQTALDWLARVERGLTPQEEAEFERWLAADTRHAAMFGEFDGVWTLLDRVREVGAVPRAGPADPDVFAPSRPAPAGVHAPGLTPPDRIRPGPVYRSSWLAAAAVVLFSIVCLGWWRVAHDDRGRKTHYAGSAATELGELRTLPLPDGSVIQLNTDTEVDVRYTATERRVGLARGEAHFTVMKDATRPFVVTAMGIGIRAVGTAFNVHLREQGLEVLVTEGKVRVNDDLVRTAPAPEAVKAAHPDEASRRNPAAGAADRPGGSEVRAVAAGEKITIPRIRPAQAAPVLAVAPVEIERTLAWQERRLEFVSAPLAEMVAEFNRYNRHKLAIADADLAAQRFGGTFRPADTAGFVRMLVVHFNIVTEQRGDETVLRRSAP